MSNARRRLVIVGNGMAGIRTLEEILARAPNAFSVTVFGDEPHGNYNRIMLSPVLARTVPFADIVTHGHDWYADRGIELIAGEAVVAIDRAAKTVRGAAGAVRGYDVLLMATGSQPFIVPVPGADLKGVVAFRGIADVQAMIETSGIYRRAVVIGGGLLGLEAAFGLACNGMGVTVLHLMPGLMERQLDQVAAEMLRRDLTQRGISIVTEARTVEIVGHDRVCAVKLADGRELLADLVVMAVGIRPATALAEAAGLATKRGVIVDDGMRSSDPSIWAVGECVEHRGAVFGLVAPIWDMARVCADTIIGREAAYEPSVSGTRLKVTGIDMFSAGDILGDAETEDVVFRDVAQGTYRKLVLRDQKLVGIVMYGDASGSGWFFDLLKNGTDISGMRDRLIFGPAFAGAGFPEAGSGAGAGTVALLADTAEVCGCNGVSKGRILAAIGTQALTTVDGVRAATKASASCGSCTGQVEQLLALALGDGFDTTPKVKPVCKCTAHGHDFVRREIRTRALRNIPDVMRELEWTTPDGCAACRPALNFYLLCEWPADYVDDAQARFTNERMHANIQKDGTYSVVPRMWGGLTNAAELRAIADVVDKYAIPTVKVTGGQRIDLLGVKRDQLPDVWRDLNAAGMVSGHAYAKALRTVKTCVGSEWCRFGKQDSTSMGVALEKMTWGTWTPHKVKLAVSGCPRNCAEATIKDFGVVAVDSGWELHVGGNGGIKVRVTDLITKVATAEEVLEYCAAFLQLYREEAWYLDRTAHWVERVGIGYVKERIVDDAAGRAQLTQRFHHSQRFVQDDPWEREAQRTERFADLAMV